MNKQQKSDVSFLIHSASATTAAIASGMAQLPLADSAAITPIQLGLIIAIGNIFGKHVTDSAAKALMLSMVAGFTGRAISQMLGGWIPFLGNALNAATAAVLTESIGWAAVSKFEKETT